MAIRMIATDLDGTLLDREKRISARTVRALRMAMDAGARLTLCSGRMPQSMLGYAESIGANAPIICYNGALTYDQALGRTLHEKLIDPCTARAVCRAIERGGQYLQGFRGEHYYYERYRDETRDYELKCGAVGQETGVKLSEFISDGVHKLLMIAPCGTIPRHLPGLRAAFADAVDFMPSSSTFLECVAKGVSKGAALRALGASLGIAPSEIMAFGDEHNDLSMLTQVGYGYAMANADESIRRQVRFVAPSSAEDGVAQVVERCVEEGLFGEVVKA